MMRYFRWLIGYLVFISSCVFAQVNPEWPKVQSESYNKTLNLLLSGSVPYIKVADLKEGINNYTILDTRAKSEFDISHIPGAIFVGPDLILENLAKVSKEKPIVVYCSVGYRSEKFGEQLIENGFSDVSNLYGGIFEWVNEDNELSKLSGGGTEVIHTYNSAWGRFITNPNCTQVN